MRDEFLWVEKYRPRDVFSTILPGNLKDTFQKIVDGGEIPNMLFSGTGTAKATVAEQSVTNLDWITLSLMGLKRGTSTRARGKIKQFAHQSLSQEAQSSHP